MERLAGFFQAFWNGSCQSAATATPRQLSWMQKLKHAWNSTSVKLLPMTPRWWRKILAWMVRCVTRLFLGCVTLFTLLWLVTQWRKLYTSGVTPFSAWTTLCCSLLLFSTLHIEKPPPTPPPKSSLRNYFIPFTISCTKYFPVSPRHPKIIRNQIVFFHVSLDMAVSSFLAKY